MCQTIFHKHPHFYDIEHFIDWTLMRSNFCFLVLLKLDHILFLSLVCRCSTSSDLDFFVLKYWSASGFFRSNLYHDSPHLKSEKYMHSHRACGIRFTTFLFFSQFLVLSFCLQQVYMYFRGSGQAAQRRQENAVGL